MGLEGTMVASLYGELVPHAWRSRDAEQDAYQLFHARSEALGWLQDRPTQVPGRAAGLWGMSDAGWQDPRGDAGSGLLSWFQVSVDAVAPDRPLPVVPFLRCAQDTTRRAGAVALSAVQVLLPVQVIHPAVRPPQAPVPSMLTRRWFDDGDPHARTAVRVAISSGGDPVVAAVAPQLGERLARLHQDVFGYRGWDVGVPDDVPAPPFDDSLWNGPSQHGVVLRGELVQWSCDAVGWFAEVVADCLAGLGVRAPVLVTVLRGT